MTKKESMYYALGMLKGYLECDRDYKTVNLGTVFGDDKYNKYELGISNCNTTVAIFDVEAEKTEELRKRVIEVNKYFYIDDLVHILLDALAYDMKLDKDE